MTVSQVLSEVAGQTAQAAAPANVAPPAMCANVGPRWPRTFAKKPCYSAEEAACYLNALRAKPRPAWFWSMLDVVETEDGDVQLQCKDELCKRFMSAASPWYTARAHFQEVNGERKCRNRLAQGCLPTCIAQAVSGL